MDINSKTDGAVFLSTPSVWRATVAGQSGHGRGFQFLSTPSVWRATTSSAFPASTPMIFLSTPSVWRATWSFNRLPLFVHLFLSTPSVWRATPSPDQCPPARWNFYPRPPCGGRLWPESRRLTGSLISIHALRVEGDLKKLRVLVETWLFLSTPSVWRATFHLRPQPWDWSISIHALRVEGDPMRKREIMAELLFLSTPSVWRATRQALHVVGTG